MDALGLTSRWVAAARARESARPDALFVDPFAAALAGDEGRAFMEDMERSVTTPSGSHENPYLAIRTRFLDDLLLAEAQKGVSQIALLAAGMDARAFRLDWPAAVTIFEVERPDVLEPKERALAAMHATPRARRVVVAADLRDDWRAALRGAGHDASRPTAFLVEGLMSYLPDEAAALSILSDAASVAAAGSLVALDVVGTSLLDSPWVKTYLAALAARGVPWRFGTDEPEALLERAGWRDTAVREAGQPGLFPERWPYPLASRDNKAIPHSYLVVARR